MSTDYSAYSSSMIQEHLGSPDAHCYSWCLLGKFIGLFYEQESKSSSKNSVQDAVFQYKLRDFLIIVYSTGITFFIDVLLYLLARTNLIELTMPRKIVMRFIKVNQIKRILP